ncbi:adenine deaminase [Sporosarcina aquimarina]|uniref:Adenine deaminase n=1 Tax=Sporosarcina aquimarina TaxID=114975 RepID=A0ABU4FVR3_9BACL|nr:adenine deaminase C-terminal domain-containing protein [Sporosarcina aquimarina]MDW0108796.1 adenine deaminase C-terminal domain-containing protein [Sporosarcina aquimarina]
MFTREQITAAARGDVKMDTVIEGVQLVNVFTAEIYQADIGIKENRFSAIARYENGQPDFKMEAEVVVDGRGKYAIPGLVDCHVHIESTMVTPDMFARALLQRGTTVAVIDPHEIGNVLGAEGVKYMVEASRGLPVQILTTIPSCVPAVPGVETAGAEFGAAEVAELLKLPDVVGIAEIMDYIGVIQQNPRMAGIVQTGLDAGVLNEGHLPRAGGRDLAAYLAAGVNSDHESRTVDEIVEKLRAGMLIYIRESSVSQFADIAAQAWQQLPYTSNIAMCTDDVEPNDMLHNGQMNRVVRRCIEEGIPAPLAIRFATLNGAQRFGLRDRGAIAPGYIADFSLVESLESMNVEDVWADGCMVIKSGELLETIKSAVPPLSKNTVKLPELTVSDFILRAPVENGKVTVTTMEMTKIGTTARGTIELDVTEGVITKLPEGYLFASVTGRHGQNTKPFVGILKNAGLREGAYATTVAHDSHNLVSVGTNAADMFAASQVLAASGGGLCLVKDGVEQASVNLPIAGLMAAEPIEQLGPKVEQFNEVARSMGVQVGRRSPSMALSSLTLTVIPEIRITDIGLVDVHTQQMIPLFV